LLICLAVALLTAELGMSLAFGAFLGGLMISRSEYSQDAFSHVMPFKDTFTSFFFVSIGMMLDLNFVTENLWLVSGTVVLVIAIKSVVAGGTAFMLGHTFRGTIVVGLALAQIGEIPNTYRLLLPAFSGSHHCFDGRYPICHHGGETHGQPDVKAADTTVAHQRAVPA
jgi:predicted Kef-type K+ transport protein